MAKEVIDMEEFNKLDRKEQEKIIKELEKAKKVKVPGAPEKGNTGAGDDWN